MNKEIDIKPCIECDGTNIDMNDCGYSSFNVAWAECQDCGHKVTIQPCSWNISKDVIAHKWNEENKRITDMSDAERLDLYNTLFPKSSEEDDDIRISDMTLYINNEDNMILDIEDAQRLSKWMVKNGYWKHA